MKETIEVEKDEKKFWKAKKNDKIVNNDRKADKVVESCKSTCIEGNGDTNVHENGCKDSVAYLKGKKEKKKRLKEKKKEGVAKISSLGVNFEDGKMDELVNEQICQENCRDKPVEDSELEQAEKNKRRKRKKEDGDNVVKNIMTNEQKFPKERNQSNRIVKEEGKLAVKEKNTDKVLEYKKMGEVAKAQKDPESGDVGDMNKDKEGDESKKKKEKEKEKKNMENVSGDLEDMKTDKIEKEQVNNDKEGDKREKKKKKRNMDNVSGDLKYMKTDKMERKQVNNDKEGDKREKKKKRKRENVSGDLEGNMKTDKVEKKQVNNGTEGDKREKKMKKRRRENVCGDMEDNVKTDKIEKEFVDRRIMEGDFSHKASRRKKRNYENNLGNKLRETIVEKPGVESIGIQDVEYVENGSNFPSTKGSKKTKSDRVGKADGNKKVTVDGLSNTDDCSKDKKKKAKTEKQVSEGNGHKGKPRTKKGTGTTEDCVNQTLQGKSKRVSFSDHVEVFSSDGLSWRQSSNVQGKVRGKRFTQEEDELVKKAVLGYIEERGLGDAGLDMILNCKSHPEVKNCWKDIAAAIPWRVTDSVYYRAHILFERDENRKWTAEEYEYVRNFVKKHGPDWKRLSLELNKHRFHCKDTWRRIKSTNLNKGRWSQEEYQSLFDLVNMDLRMRALEERKSKHGMLRDNISWEAISDRLSTRTNAMCCLKWYKQLSSPMVREGLWADVDDYRMLDVLSNLDAPCIEEVDWDNLLEHRDGYLCRKRWNQMVKHIGDYGNKSFSEQVEVLSSRYSPDSLEAREVWDSKPIVD